MWKALRNLNEQMAIEETVIKTAEVQHMKQLCYPTQPNFKSEAGRLSNATEVQPLKKLGYQEGLKFNV